MEPMISGAKSLKTEGWTGIAPFVLPLFLLTVAGCGTLHDKSYRSVLTEDEQRLADALAHYAQGLVHQKEIGDNSPEALESFTKAVELDPENYALHSAVAMLAHSQDDPKYETALEHYAKAIELAPSKAVLYMALAELHFAREQDAEAFEALRRGMENTDSRTLLLHRAFRYVKIFIRRRSVERAVTCLKFLAEYSEQPRRYHHLLGHLYAGLDKREEAIAQYTLATDDENPLAESFIALATLYADTEPDKAVETLIRGSQRVPDDVHILFALAQWYSAEDKFDEAIAIFAKIKNLTQDIQKQTLTAEVYLKYGATCERAGRFEEAEKIFEECIELHPDAHRVLNYLAYMWAEEGVNLDRAHSYVTRALSLKPGDAAYIDTLGWIFYKQKRYELALRMIEKAAGLIEDDPVIRDHLGDIHRALGDHERAMREWSQSFRLDSSSKSVAAKLSRHGVDLDRLREEGKELKKAAEAERKRQELKEQKQLELEPEVPAPDVEAPPPPEPSTRLRPEAPAAKP